MEVLVSGFASLIFGVVTTRFLQLRRALKEQDPAQFEKLMGPSSNFIAHFNTIALYSWAFSRGYEKSLHKNIQASGARCIRKATVAKYCMLVGVVLIAVGFSLTLIQFD